MSRQDIRFDTAADGTQIAWAAHGTGYPLVRVGTFMTHLLYDWESPTWQHWLRDLGARFTYVRYDERGCGLSSRQPPEFSVEAWLDDQGDQMFLGTQAETSAWIEDTRDTEKSFLVPAIVVGFGLLLLIVVGVRVGGRPCRPSGPGG